MSKEWKIALVFLLLAFGVGYLVRFGCNKPKETATTYIDSSDRKELTQKNAVIDRLQGNYFNYVEKSTYTKDSMQKVLKSLRNRFSVKYIEIKKDSLITDSACILALDYANGTLVYYDSVYMEQGKSLDSCRFYVDKLTGHNTYLRSIAALEVKDKAYLIKENSSFKHLFLRWYWKRKE